MDIEIKHKDQTFKVCFNDQFEPLIKQYKWHLAQGYARTSLYNKGKKSSISMHRLILNTFRDKKHTHHINENKLDNRLENLIILDQSSHFKNHHFSFKKIIGSKNGASKLTEKQALEIRQLFSTGKYSGRMLAKAYGIGHTTMYYLLKRKTWKHI